MLTSGLTCKTLLVPTWVGNEWLAAAAAEWLGERTHDILEINDQTVSWIESDDIHIDSSGWFECSPMRAKSRRAIVSLGEISGWIVVGVVSGIDVVTTALSQHVTRFFLANQIECKGFYLDFDKIRQERSDTSQYFNSVNYIEARDKNQQIVTISAPPETNISHETVAELDLVSVGLIFENVELKVNKYSDIFIFDRDHSPHAVVYLLVLTVRLFADLAKAKSHEELGKILHGDVALEGFANLY